MKFREFAGQFSSMSPSAMQLNELLRESSDDISDYDVISAGTGAVSDIAVDHSLQRVIVQYA